MTLMKKIIIVVSIAVAFFAAFTLNAQILLTDFGSDGFELQGWSSGIVPTQQFDSLTLVVPSLASGGGFSGETYNYVDISTAWEGETPIQTICIDVIFAVSYADYISVSFGDDLGGTWRYENSSIGLLNASPDPQTIALTFVGNNGSDVDLSRINYFAIELATNSGSFNGMITRLYVNSIPEPSTWLLLGAGLTVTVIFHRKRK